MKKILAVTLLALLGTGCATTTSYTYQDHRSEAFNIARAGGLREDIRDTEVPADSIGSVTETMLKVGFIGSGYMKPVLGMSNWQTMGLNVVAETAGLASHGQRNSIMAWMPESAESSPESAQKALVSHMKTGIQTALDGMGATHEVILEQDLRPGIEVTILFVNDSWNCPKWAPGQLSSTCRAQFRIQRPTLKTAPSFVTSSDEQHYSFESDHKRHYNRMNLLISDQSSVPQDELYATISKNLPEWVYLYLAPGKVINEASQPVDFPYILNQGEAKLFVIPEQ